MTQKQNALLWGLIIITVTVFTAWIDMPAPSIALLVSSLAAGMVVSGNRCGNGRGCRS